MDQTDGKTFVGAEMAVGLKDTEGTCRPRFPSGTRVGHENKRATQSRPAVFRSTIETHTVTHVRGSYTPSFSVTVVGEGVAIPSPVPPVTSHVPRVYATRQVTRSESFVNDDRESEPCVKKTHILNGREPC